MILPEVVHDVVSQTAAAVIPQDTVLQELNALVQDRGGSFALALYLLGFGSYTGFT
ncbi:MAG: hypothetical protein FWG31_08775 [Oscillospiraceae bacterium]|nr:hypothetical protein [Oscillospiraceae bacterium]